MFVSEGKDDLTVIISKCSALVFQVALNRRSDQIVREVLTAICPGSPLGLGSCHTKLSCTDLPESVVPWT